MLSPQSQQAIDTLLAGDRLGSTDTAIGPFTTNARTLLKVMVDHRDALQKAAGESQANALRRYFVEEVKRTEPLAQHSVPRAIIPSQNAGSAKWRLHKVTCQSIRGLVPYGHLFEFEFAGKSNLIYGPNGSGKSSLMAAVSWVLLDVPVTDADDPHNDTTAPIRATGKAGTNAKKIGDWPVMAALPETIAAAATAPAYWSRIELREATGSRVLHLRRDGNEPLQSSEDGQTWKSCDNLANVGISTLDLQLSLAAPTAFGRRTLEACEGTRDVLSLMLGYDDLELLGAIVTNVTGNCTRLHNREKTAIDSRKAELLQKLEQLPAMLPDTHPLHVDLAALADAVDPSVDQIQKVGTKVSIAVAESQQHLASLLDITGVEEDPPSTLADKLIAAVNVIEQGISHCFPSLERQRVEIALPAGKSLTSEAQLEQIEVKLKEHVANAQAQIASRYEWWEKETAPGSRLSLLLKAAQHYDAEAQECPVCDQSVASRPIKDELEQLKIIDPEFIKDVEIFFARLKREFLELVPPSLMTLADAVPADRLQQDWQVFRDHFIGTELSSITARYEAPMRDLVAALPPLEEDHPDLLPPEVKDGFARLAEELTAQVAKGYRAVAILRWNLAHADDLGTRLRALVTNTEGDPPSLLAALLKGKQAAANARPLKSIQVQLRTAFTERQSIDGAEADLMALGTLRQALQSLKGLRGYAQGAVEKVFTRIAKATQDNWKLLYGEMATGLGPGALELGTSRSKSIEARLTREGGYDVPSQHFANAGLRRTIALAFYFALLEEHPGGLGFISMDDPILSLDEEHRETWSRELLRPRMEKFQFIVATHQRQYLNNCRNDFANGHTFELVPRHRPGKVAWRPGNRLDRAEEELARAPTNANNEMRKYREELFAALELYNPAPIALNTDTYDALHSPNPLAAGYREQIVKALRSPEIAKVLDPGSHALTEADVSAAMARRCLYQMRQLNDSVVKEFQRLDERAHRSKRSLGMIVPADKLAGLPHRQPSVPVQSALVIGRAAAQSDRCVIEESIETTPLDLTVSTAALVSGHSLDPVAQCGQWVLLADASVMPHDGDLVAAQDANGHRYLRRAWSDGERWLLHAINPVLNVPAVTIPKEAPLQAVVGVLHEQLREPTTKQAGICEWQPRADFDFAILNDVHLVRVEGDSLNPIARRGQYVMVASGALARGTKIAPGTLAVVDTTDSSIGQVIKCVYPREGGWILTSRNPVEAISPLVVSSNAVKSVWPVRGVLFEGAVAEVIDQSDSDAPIPVTEDVTA